MLSKLNKADEGCHRQLLVSVVHLKTFVVASPKFSLTADLWEPLKPKEGCRCE